MNTNAINAPEELLGKGVNYGGNYAINQENHHQLHQTVAIYPPTPSLAPPMLLAENNGGIEVKETEDGTEIVDEEFGCLIKIPKKVQALTPLQVIQEGYDFQKSYEQREHSRVIRHRQPTVPRPSPYPSSIPLQLPKDSSTEELSDRVTALIKALSLN